MPLPTRSARAAVREARSPAGPASRPLLVGTGRPLDHPAQIEPRKPPQPAHLAPGALQVPIGAGRDRRGERAGRRVVVAEDDRGGAGQQVEAVEVGQRPSQSIL